MSGGFVSVSVAQRRYPILLSIVIVVDGWAHRVHAVTSEVRAEIEKLVEDYEIIFVDNAEPGSREFYNTVVADTGQPNVQVYRLLSRVDYEVAAWAGVESSLGDYVLVFDPFNEDLSALARALEHASTQGDDLVLIVNEARRKHGIGDTILRRAYLSLFKMMGGINLQIEGSHHRLMSKRVVSYLLLQPRPASRYRALPAIAGFRKSIIRYQAPRQSQAKGSTLGDARRAIRLLLSHSVAPARVASTLSLVSAGLNALYSVYVVILAITRNNLQPGWTTLSLQQAGMFFIFSLLIFILTEYAIDNIRGGRSASGYFVIDEMGSAVLTRRQRLNVETQGMVLRPEDPAGTARNGTAG
ncbi:glycosyltransferase [Sphingomonas sp. ABOLF]|uniref:glycosyltransferase n=1 Tax=Sphingomonas sp. ABOLF TaxID=1985879 RepID=UPI000F7E74A6|nr:glycosyltransferase [Sphingomonas sp. ABOLF]RSV12302.1 glycosyltransferase [Sphingomonas sp. ABOLF]